MRFVEALVSGGKNVSEIAAAVGMGAVTVSRHLRVLHDAQVVDCSRRGNFVLYVLADREVARLAAVAYSGAGQAGPPTTDVHSAELTAVNPIAERRRDGAKTRSAVRLRGRPDNKSRSF